MHGQPLPSIFMMACENKIRQQKWKDAIRERERATATNTQQDGPSNRVKPHNNQPSSKQAKDTIRKPFLGSTSRWIVVVVSWSFKKFKGVK